MYKSNEKFKNSLWNMLGSVMYGANSFLLLVLVTRHFGKSSAGMFGIAFTTAQILWIIGIFGASHYMMTDFNEQFSFSTYRSLKLITGAAMLISSIPVCLILKFGKEKTILTVVLTVYMFAHSFSELYQSRAFQKNRLDISGKCQFFRTFISFLSFSVALYCGASLLICSIVMTVVNIICILPCSYIPCRQFCKLDRIKARETKNLAISCAPLFFSVFLLNIVLNIPKYAVEYFCNSSVQGVFNIIFMPAQVINLVSSFIFRPMLKGINDGLHADDNSFLVELIKKLFSVIAVLTFLCAFCAWLFGVSVIGWFCNIDLTGYRLPIVLIVVGGGMFAMCSFLYYIAVILRCQKKILYNYLICVAVEIPLCIPLVKHNGLAGASECFCIIHTLVIIIYLRIIHCRLEKHDVRDNSRDHDI